MKITLEIPEETVCMSIVIGIQNEIGWGTATFAVGSGAIYDNSEIQLNAEIPPKESES